MTVIFSAPLSEAIAAGWDTSDVTNVHRHELHQRDAEYDRTLVPRVRMGDGDAFAILVKHYLERATRFAMCFIHTRDAAEDLVQEAFIAVWEQRATLDATRSFRSYLFRAVRNRALNERTTQAVRHRYQAEVMAQSQEVSTSSGYATGSETLAETDLEVYIRQLAPRRQTAIRLRYDVGLSHTEIGEAMGISTMAATQLVLRGLEDLKRLLAV